MEGDQDFTLPKLSPRLMVFEGAPDPSSGSPTSTLHDPIANTYFKLGWIESECLARFSQVSTASGLQSLVKQEAGLYVTLDDIRNLAEFLVKSGLTDQVPQGAVTREVEHGFLKSLLHKYLYFTIPLFHPQQILNRIYPVLAPLFSQVATRIVLAMLGIMGLVTFARVDEFITTYPDLFSVSGLIQMAVLYAVIKIIHEWSHALTATKFGVPVPHMGVAFIVLYPVLYTETSGAWRLTDKRQRAAIGLAGIRAELAVAAIALFIWNISPPSGTAQTLSFLVVTVSLVSSLLINLNPLMRFDGYYILSDYLGFANMQTRACNFARWKLRDILFALGENEPEHQDKRTKYILTYFGFLLLVYRFLLFTGIAVLVYHMFFKPLGLLLFCVEIWYFILKPILSELKIWKEKWPEIMVQRRARLTFAGAGFILVLLSLPLYGTVSAPAIVGYKNDLEIHAPHTAEIEEILIREGEPVKKNDVLAILKSPELEKNLDLARQNLKRLETEKRQTTIYPDQPSKMITDERIESARKKIALLEDQKDHLVIAATFDGTIREIGEGLKRGRTVKTTDKLMRLVDESGRDFTAYISESDLSYIDVGSNAIFFPEPSPLTAIPLEIAYIEKLNSSDLTSLELVSFFGGDITGHHNKDGKFIPAQGLYRVSLTMKSPKSLTLNFRIRGIIQIEGRGRSPLVGILRRVTGFVLRELSWN